MNEFRKMARGLFAAALTRQSSKRREKATVCEALEPRPSTREYPSQPAQCSFVVRWVCAATVSRRDCCDAACDAAQISKGLGLLRCRCDRARHALPTHTHTHTHTSGPELCMCVVCVLCVCVAGTLPQPRSRLIAFTTINIRARATALAQHPHRLLHLLPATPCPPPVVVNNSCSFSTTLPPPSQPSLSFSAVLSLKWPSTLTRPPPHSAANPLPP